MLHTSFVHNCGTYHAVEAGSRNVRSVCRNPKVVNKGLEKGLFGELIGIDIPVIFWVVAITRAEYCRKPGIGERS